MVRDQLAKDLSKTTSKTALFKDRLQAFDLDARKETANVQFDEYTLVAVQPRVTEPPTPRLKAEGSAIGRESAKVSMQYESMELS